MASLGFGVSGPLGQFWFSRADTMSLLRRAFDGGVRHFDTAPFYGDGEAESRLGDALAGAGDIFVSTKTGTRRRGRRVIKDFSPESLRADVEESRKRLRRDRVDLLYLHGPAPRDVEAAREPMLRMIEEGLIGAWGVCGEGKGLEAGVAAGADWIMGPFNIVDRRHGSTFENARAAGLRTVAIAPLAQGLFNRKFFRIRSMADGWRVARAILRRRTEMDKAYAVRDLLESMRGWTPAQAALAFVMSQPFLDAAITTTVNPAHLDESLDAARRRLEPSQVAALAALCLDVE